MTAGKCWKLKDRRNQRQRVHLAISSSISHPRLSFHLRGLCGPIVALAPRRVALRQHRYQDCSHSRNGQPQRSERHLKNDARQMPLSAQR